MAWVRKRASGRWTAHYRDPSGAVRSVGAHDGRKGTTFTHKKDALAAARAEENRILHDDWIDPRLAQTPFEELAEKYLLGVQPVLKPKTVASYESLLRSRILPTFGHRPVRALKPSDITTWIGSMVGDGISPSRARQAHVVLRLVLDTAMRDGYLTRNPAVGVKLPRLEHREARFFEPAVVDGIVEAVGPPYSVLVALMGTLGLRYGEAVALRGRHVDVLRRRLIVKESLAEVSGTFVFGSTKSHAERDVPVPRSILAELPAVAPGELLFTGPQRKGPLRYRYFYMRVWRPALETLGLPVVGIHALRHSSAARMLSKGASAKTLQTVLGHRSAAFSLTVYGHLMNSDLDALAERLDEREVQ